MENLVTQFSTALDCFRELVQNALDAGSPSVDVWMEFERGQGHTGVISAHVDDYGEGMDEAIIDNQLTCLFSSTKENDLTKIGKFGIGFVSVFALKPKGVLVQTGRAGQYWEVFFYEDRTFTKTPMDTPCEGTQITLFLEGDYRRYRELVEGVRANLKRWCVHADQEIGFEDRTPHGDAFAQREVINEPFVVQGACLTHVEHQGTEIAVAYSHTPLYGFYNRGLTLALETVGENVLDRRAARYQHITFKIKSRYLEHTLSRETIMRDANYERAMRLMDEALDGPLLERLAQSLEALVSAPAWGHDQIATYLNLLSFLRQEPPEAWQRLSSRPLLRLLHGQPTSLDALAHARSAQGHLLVADQRTALTDALAAQGVPTLFGSLTRSPQARAAAEQRWLPTSLVVKHLAHMQAKQAVGRARALVGALIQRPVDHEAEVRQTMAWPEQLYLPVSVDAQPPGDCAALVAHAQTLLQRAQTPYRRLTTCTLSAPEPQPPLFVVAPKLGALMSRPPKSAKAPRQLEAAVNRDHPHMRLLVQRFAAHPEHAAYCLAKDLLLDQDRDLELDQTLMALARQLVTS